MYKMLKMLDQTLGFEVASAHCDIPCKIYDPIIAQIASLSVVRLIDIMHETPDNRENLSAFNTLTRCVLRKEEEAEKVKQEVRTIWGDYFKTPQFESHPEIHQLTHEIMLKASACKQGTSRESALELVTLVNQFAAAFWDTKGLKVEKRTCPYPPSLETVYPVL